VPRCTYCRGNLGHDRDRVGARCPHCHQPLYERPRDPHQADPRMATATACTVHAGNPALGTCQRCGNFLCAVCFTRWQERAVCSACIERLLERNETGSPETRAHRRQAILGVLFGAGAWLLSVGAFFLMMLGASQGLPTGAMLIGLGVLLLLPSPLVATLGLGQALAALRCRGNHMVLASIGFFLSGLELGVVLGALTSVVIEQARN
jgi:hypothetical protein